MDFRGAVSKIHVILHSLGSYFTYILISVVEAWIEKLSKLGREENMSALNQVTGGI